MEPLAYLLRPEKLEEILGQEHLIGEGKYLTEITKTKKYKSLILYGNPGIGKTSIAEALGKESNLPVEHFNAVEGSKKDLDKIFEKSKEGQVVLILDEVHRLNKDKQDLLLPHIENGNIILIGMTTSNPLFAINPAIRSRCLLLEIKQASNKDLVKIVNKAIAKSNELNNENKTISNEVINLIVDSCSGDIRSLINNVEYLLTFPYQEITIDIYKEVSLLQSGANLGSEDEHYNLVSAFQKSIRGSDVNAALYYFGQLAMIGDLESIARRLIVTAYEDIGLADLNICSQTAIAINSARQVGFPEASLILAPIIIKLCLSPKSKSAHDAIKKVEQSLKNKIYDMPEYLKLSQSKSRYPYNNPNVWKDIQYLPSEIKNIKFYEPNKKSEQELLKIYEVLNNYHKNSNF